MTDLEQLAALIELLDSPVHADAETHDSEHGACTECPVPLFSRPPLEIAHAIINAGWTPPPTITAETCCPNPEKVDTSTYATGPTFRWICGCNPHCNLAVEPIP